MKQLMLVFIAMLTFAFAQAQTAVKQTTPPKPDPLQMKQMEYDFGKIPQNKPVFHYFEVMNTGTVPVVIDNITAACGCTTPEWSRDAIPPGGTAQVKVGYNAAAEGVFEKMITLQYNAGTSKTIKIKGTVWKAPTGSAPANASVQFLKQQIH